AKAGRPRACTASTCHPFSRRRSRAWRRESASNTPRWARPSRSQAR
ncbi:CxxxxCH/CxxCH domain-containing protein, partial [Serratia marcescens]